VDVGIHRALSDLLGPEKLWAQVGLVEEIEDDADLGLLLNVTLVDGAECQARLVYGGALLTPIAVGDEVLVVFPNGDPNMSIAFIGAFSRAAPMPSCFDNTTPQIVHANGVEVRLGEADTVQPVVLEALLPDLLGALTEVNAMLVGLGFPATNMATLLSGLATLYRSDSIKSSGA
jgi:hypothetical protein